MHSSGTDFISSCDEVYHCCGKEEYDGGFGNDWIHYGTGAGKKGAVFAFVLLCLR